MLSKHPERCRFPHGHTRTVEVVVAGDRLDTNGMLVDFKALKLAIEDLIERYDHSMAVNSADPFLSTLRAQYGDEAIVVFQDQEPTTEAMAHRLFEEISSILQAGFEGASKSGAVYRIPAGSILLERIRVWETPDSWAEYTDLPTPR
jgi:6-pyruvoyltetrahydropterin/6-carboxytetrahydropterin synthase